MKKRRYYTILLSALLSISMVIQSALPMAGTLGAVNVYAADEDILSGDSGNMDILEDAYNDALSDIDPEWTALPDEYGYTDDAAHSDGGSYYEEVQSPEAEANARRKESDDEFMSDEAAMAYLRGSAQSYGEALAVDEGEDILPDGNSPDGKVIWKKAWIRINGGAGEQHELKEAINTAILLNPGSPRVDIYHNMSADWPIEIDGNRTKSPVSIYLNGNSLWANDDKGVNVTSSKKKNPFFRLKNGATLNIYGGRLDSLQSCDNITQKGAHNVWSKHYFSTGRLVGSYNSQNGGAIICETGTTLNLIDLTIANCATDDHGGAIYAESQVAINMSGSKITSCYSNENGGAIYIKGTQCNISMDDRTEINENYAADHGGAIYLNSDKINIYANGASMKNNFSAKDGGAVYMNSSKCSLSNAVMKNNVAKGKGGGVYFDSSDCSVKNTKMTDNAANEGGAAYANGKQNGFSDCEITGNKAEKSDNTGVGGGIFVSSTDDICLSGRMIIKDNSSKALAHDDLYLNKVAKSVSRMDLGSMHPRSEVYLRFDSIYNDRRLTRNPGNHDARLFKLDEGGQAGYYIYFDDSSADMSKTDLYRHLLLEKGSGEGVNRARVVNLPLDSNKTATFASNYKYKAGDGQEYDVVYGYASSPSHTEDTVDIVNKYFWSDGYFMDDPKTYNPHLATMGMNMAMASADSNVKAHADYRYKFDNVKSVLRGIGCDEKDIYINDWYIKKPTDDSIGVAIAKKTIKSKADNKEYTLVPIAIRSYGYEKEWASNMTINSENTSGTNDESSGFKSARTHVMEEVAYFVKNYGLEKDLKEGKVKFWLTGFSRGSATANLTGKFLVDTYGVYSTEYKDHPNQVYAYCYAVPAGGTDNHDKSLTSENKDGYRGIHNIINKVDLTPMVAPEKMGFKRYGVDHFVPGDAAGEVKKSETKASDKNGGYTITKFYDNNAWYVGDNNYLTQRKNMVKHLLYVNDTITFNDYFNEFYMTMGVKNFITSFGDAYSFNKVDRDKTKKLETWLPDFYDKLQTYNVIDKNTSLTRNTYSVNKVQSGSGEWAADPFSAQQTFRELVMLMLSKTPSEKEALSAALGGVVNKLSFGDKKNAFYDLVNDKEGWDKGKTEDDMKSMQNKWLTKFWGYMTDRSHGQKSIEDSMSAKELKNFKKAFPALMGIVLRLVRDDYNKNGDKAYILGTFAKNADAVLQGHVPEIALAWLRTYDDYYNNEDCAYRFTGNESVAAAPTAELKEGTNGDYVVTLKSDGSEIYYTLKHGSAPASQIKLYEPGTGIVLFAPPSGICTYTVEAYAIKGYANGKGERDWKESPKASFSYDVKASSKTESTQTADTLTADALIAEDSDEAKLQDIEEGDIDEAGDTAADGAEPVMPDNDGEELNPVLQWIYGDYVEMSIYDSDKKIIADRSFDNFIIPRLPKAVNVLTDDDSITYLPVHNWKLLEEGSYDPNSTDAQEFMVLGYTYVPEDWGVQLDCLNDDGDRHPFVSEKDGYVAFNVYTDGLEETTLTPYATVPSGTYDSSINVVLKCDFTNDASDDTEISEADYTEFYYTTDGTSPVDEYGNVVKTRATKYEPVITGTETVQNEDGTTEEVEFTNTNTITIDSDTTLMFVAKTDGKLTSSVQTVDYVITKKPLPLVDEDIWDELDELYLIDGGKLSDLTLPEGFKWDETGCDPDRTYNLSEFEDYDSYEMFKDEDSYTFYASASLIYNPDEATFSDLEVSLDIPVYSTRMDIITENCDAYDLDGEKISSTGEGETVYLVPGVYADPQMPGEAFVFDKWEVKDADGNEVQATLVKKEDLPEEITEAFTVTDNIASFVMPGKAVTAKAQFKKGSGSGSGETDEPGVYLEGLSVNDFDDDNNIVIDLKTGEQRLLMPTLMPLESTDMIQSVSWKVASSKVASISKGLVTAKSKTEGETDATVIMKVKKPGEKKAVEYKQVFKIHVTPTEYETAKIKNISNDKSYALKAAKNSVKIDLSSNSTCELEAIMSKVEAAAGTTLSFTSLNEDIVAVEEFEDKAVADGKKAKAKATLEGLGIGTTYVIVKGVNDTDESKYNQRIVKVTVVASNPEIYVSGDSQNAYDEDANKITLKKGSYDRIYIEFDPEQNTDGGKLSWKGSGGITVKNGVIYAGKVTKPNKPATLTISCGKTKGKITVVVTD